VYVGSQFVHKSDDDGQSWQVISPDLTLNDKTHQQNSGGIAIDNLMTFDGATLFSIEESVLEAGVIWTGSNDGQVQLTKDGGENWTNVTGNIPNLPKWGTIANIEPSRYKKGTVYITVDLHQMGDFDPYVYKTEDYGQSWKLISATVPRSVHSFAHVIKEDPKREGMLYLGVDNGLYISYDDGQNWMRLRNNLPPAPIYWLEIQERFDDLVIGTYGRGYYIMDDISALREFDVTSDKDVHLFGMREAYRFQDQQAIKTDGPSLNSGQNPAYGAYINYFLKDSTDKKVEVQILTETNELVRTLEGKKSEGVHRTVWDLRYEPTYRPRLQTTPPGRPWVQLNGEGWRPLVTWDLDLWRGQYGPRVVPGKYKAKLVIGEQEFIRDFEVLKDPSTAGSLKDIEEQVGFSLELRDAMNLAVTMINDIEEIRAELEEIRPQLTTKKDKRTAALLIEKSKNIAAALYDIHLTGAREDAFRSPMKLYGRLSSLASDIGGFGVDFKPTDQQREVYQVLNARLKNAEDKFKSFIEVEVEALNQQLKKSELQLEFGKKIKS